ncbi:MAG: sulfite exporter TauE/SafE family protein [Firmicutes bacterium]|nr:sulfite exporter TauE/SafE family protein [Bacillota bacterium]
MKKWFKSIAIVLIVISSGAVTGLLGGGGGMLVVPMLVYLFGKEQKKAQATAIALIALASIAASFGYFKNTQSDWRSLLFVIGGAIMGTILGAVFLKKANNKTLKYAFYVLMLVSGVLMLLKGLGIL